MDLRTKRQIAELIDDSLVAQGFKGSTTPFLWLRKLFGPLFERSVPMEGMSMRQFRFAVILYLGLLPLVLGGVVLALPFELHRALRARRHNEGARGVLLSGGGPQSAAESGTDNGERVIVDYRIEREGRGVFFGVALVSVTTEAKRLVGFTVHRSTPPRDALNGGAVRSALAKVGAATPELFHWEWPLHDPLELVERGATPW